MTFFLTVVLLVDGYFLLAWNGLLTVYTRHWWGMTLIMSWLDFVWYHGPSNQPSEKILTTLMTERSSNNFLTRCGNFKYEIALYRYWAYQTWTSRVWSVSWLSFIQMWITWSEGIPWCYLTKSARNETI